MAEDKEAALGIFNLGKDLNVFPKVLTNKLNGELKRLSPDLND